MLEFKTFHFKNTDDIENNLNLFGYLKYNHIYHRYGVFEDVWTNPFRFIKSEAYLSYAKIKEEIVSVMFLPKEEWYGWDYHKPDIRKTYGMIGFYTKAKYRKQGIAKSIFNNFDKEFSIRKLCSTGHANNIISEVKETEKYCIL